MYININGQNIYYQKVGQGKDLVLLHGWGQDVSSWWGVIDSLKSDFTLWMIDLPGFGRSDLEKDFKVLDYANLVSEFIKLNKIKQPHLLGHSLGGNISIKLASRNGELIDKLILEDSSGIRPQKSLSKVLILPLAKFFHYFVPEWFGFKEKIRRRFYQAVEADYINAGNLKNTLTNILSEDLSDELNKIKNDTLILWGQNDKAVSYKYGVQMYKNIPNSRIEILDNLGHFPHLENPAQFVYYVKDFS